MDNSSGERRSSTLKDQAQAHLDLPGAADRFVHRTKPRGAIEEGNIGFSAHCTSSGQRRSFNHGVLVVNIVNRNIEAGCVRDVEDIERVLQKNRLSVAIPG